MTEKEIDGMLESIEEAVKDGNYLAADNLCLLTVVKLLADIKKDTGKIERITMAQLETSA